MAKANILIVEDNEIVASDINRRIKKLGYSVAAIVSSGEEAINKAQEHHPDLVLMDIVLKGEMDGIEAADLIHTRFNVPVVYLTANTDTTILNRAKQTEPFGYIIKPFKDRELTIAIEIALYKYKSEKRLCEKEQYYRSMLHNLHENIIVIDGDYRITDLNNTILKTLGFKRKDVIGRYCFEVFHGHNEPCARMGEMCYLEEVFKTGEARSCQHENTHVKGSKVFVDIRFSPMKDKGGNVTHVVEAIRDITERKRAEQALKESEEKHRTFLELNPDPVIVYDCEGKVIYLNPAFTRVFGWSLAERSGKKMDGFVPKEFWQETKKLIEKVMAGGTFSTETSRYTKDGNMIPVSISGATYHDFEGNTLGSIINIRDITEQRNMEERLRQSQKMESLGTLAGGIAHDFNNILFPIVGYTEMVLEDLEHDNVARKNLEEVFKAGQRAQSLVKQILAFSRQTREERQPVQVKLILKEELKLLNASLPSTIEIRPNILSSSVINADSTEIHQIIMNLCTNAYYAMRDSGGVLDITLDDTVIPVDDPMVKANFSPGPYIRLKIGDTGAGMSDLIMQRIFDPYFTTKAKGEGTGLGLSTVHGIVKSLKGDITVASKYLKGSAFTIYLPLIENPDQRLPGFTSEIAPTGHEHILLVDDEEMICKMMKPMLERIGYRVTTYTDALEAAAFFEHHSQELDLLITDMTMPKLTGTDLTRRVKEVRPDFPVILMTGNDHLVEKEKATSLGVREFVIKPVRKAEMAKTIRKALTSDNAE